MQDPILYHDRAASSHRDLQFMPPAPGGHASAGAEQCDLGSRLDQDGEPRRVRLVGAGVRVVGPLAVVSRNAASRQN